MQAEAVAPRGLQLVTLIKEGRHHVIEVREGFFDVKRRDAQHPLYRAYTRQLAELYFVDVERNHARQARYESWRRHLDAMPSDSEPSSERDLELTTHREGADAARVAAGVR